MVEYNVIRQNGQSGIHADGLNDSTIRGNLINHNGLHGIRALKSSGVGNGPQNLRIVGNTIAGVGALSDRAAIKFGQDMGGHTIFNNVLQAAVFAISVSNPNFKSGRNAIAAPGFSLDGATTTLTLAQWRAQAGAYDVDSVTGTATSLFVNPASDFRLAGGSPAANAGVATYNAVPAPTVDLLGVPRPQGGAHDIGAFESF